MEPTSPPLSIVVVGASGDLARKKVFPALFALYCQGLLPAPFNVFGFARSPYSDEEFREKITANLACRYAPGESCADRMSEFLARCHYVPGQYESADSFLDLFSVMQEHEQREPANRLFYLAIPPSIFVDVAKAIGNSGLVQCGESDPWSRVVIEKPFGRDRASSDTLTEELSHVFTENQTYRIDHYLGKEVIQNLLVLRFANLVFEPIWNRTYIESVQIVWKEDLDVSGRGGYFDSYGIIRDVMQNHLLQILALVAMDPPASLDAHDVRDAKVKLLRSVPAVPMDHLAVGQYARTELDGHTYPAYTDDETVPDDSRTPTLAAAVLHVKNARWEGVPFLIKAGKGLDSRMTEIKIRFKPMTGTMYCDLGSCPMPNELVIRVQPDESIYFTITNKVPGLGMRLEQRRLDLRYKAAFTEEIPDAYESLILDVMRGEKSLFIRSDELAAAWDIFTPVLHELEETGRVPDPYDFKSHGPDSARRLAEDHNVAWREDGN